METIVTAARVERRQPPGEPIPAAAVWTSLTQAQQERVHQAVVEVCRERLREERGDESA